MLEFRFSEILHLGFPLISQRRFATSAEKSLPLATTMSLVFLGPTSKKVSMCFLRPMLLQLALPQTQLILGYSIQSQRFCHRFSTRIELPWIWLTLPPIQSHLAIFHGCSPRSSRACVFHRASPIGSSTSPAGQRRSSSSSVLSGWPLTPTAGISLHVHSSCRSGSGPRSIPRRHDVRK